MKLRRLKADGFGLLRGEWHFDPTRFNLVIDENERGKTSLLHAVVAGLYGLDGDGRRYRGLMTPLERWRPWDGGAYRIELDIESEGDTYTIRRDFQTGAVEVWNDRAQDVTHDFATEKDGFSIGQPMLGLDAEEFTKCAFWRQGELADVVPDAERERRSSTLQARLESAADTRAGDASAVEAIQALEAALKAFESPVMGTTITLDNTLKRLEALRDKLTVDLKSLEHDYRSVAEPLGNIAALTEEERVLKARLQALEARGASLRARDATRQLERDAKRRAELDALRAEVESLTPLGSVPLDAETVLAAVVARHSELAARLNAARTKRRGFEPERERAAETLAASAALAGRGVADADLLAVRAGELRRSNEERARAEAECRAALDAVRAQGLDPDWARTLVPRFDALTVERGDLLRDQPRFALMQQTDVATAEQIRSMGRTMLRDLRRWKRPRYVVGGAVAALGLAAVGVALALAPGVAVSRPALIIGGAIAAAAGAAAIVATLLARRGARTEAHARLVEADELLRQSQLRAAENDTQLRAAAAELGYEAPDKLVEDWGQAQRLRDLHGPVHAAEQQLATIERQRAAIVAAAASLAANAGDEVTPEALESVAIAIRERVAAEAAHVTIMRQVEVADAEAAQAEVLVAEVEQQAVATIRSAGLVYEPGASWSSWVAEVATQVRGATRRRGLIEGEMPLREAELLDPARRSALQGEIDRAPAVWAHPADGAVEAASPAQLDVQTAEARERLEAVRDERERLRLSFQKVDDDYHTRHPGILERLEAVEHELARARRFNDSVHLARETIEQVAIDTHRRWADFLNRRVTDLLKDMGSTVSRVRFGEDLDFSVTLPGGQQSARGKAVHQLSSGARDQLHLAVRLAISEFLSRGGESLPLLIDDCFATSDDDRTRHGMKLLLESFTRQHQVVFVTCHRSRHEALAALDPALYADRVHWLELRSGVTTLV